ncbi:hypothetical protein PR202_gb02865 [Eleusine coracana subsp. coracana]|uniref:Uncharacterized protein n=1 Tax=Eleusine coracana subsp. coracana TaxID=191504 RepID=A0AAV5DZJ4_ELECO|nr:hypothetical protein QOZ80_8BG0663740 [Eleusine coracana subsp. coracana]GJN15918.1 hypothetical protein PR202_gb02865 [Eleusine coracana subsp. coracana]
MEADPGDAKWTKEGAAGGVGGLDWGLERQFAFEREMLMMADDGLEPQKQPAKGWRQRPFAADLLQNCDLPPPSKLFGPGPTLQRLESADRKAATATGGDKDTLLRALRLSQSRAREVEEKLAAAGASNGDLAALLVRDAVALSAHRRWVMMLEAENSLLRGGGAAAEPEPDAGEARGGGVAAWWVALAVCVGIAGVGLALGTFLG